MNPYDPNSKTFQAAIAWAGWPTWKTLNEPICPLRLTVRNQGWCVECLGGVSPGKRAWFEYHSLLPYEARCILAEHLRKKLLLEGIEIHNYRGDIFDAVDAELRVIVKAAGYHEALVAAAAAMGEK